MTTSEDPLARAFAAVDRLHTSDLDPVARVAWQEAWDALHEVLREREAFAAVVRRGRELIDALDQYDAASEDENTAQLVGLAEEAEAAEDAFVEALDRAPIYPESEDKVSSEATRLEALDRFADDDADDEEPRH